MPSYRVYCTSFLWLIPLILGISKYLVVDGIQCCGSAWRGDIMDDKQAYPCQKNSKVNVSIWKQECKNGEESCYCHLLERPTKAWGGPMATVSCGCLSDKSWQCFQKTKQFSVDESGKCTRIANTTMMQNIILNKCLHQPDDNQTSFSGDGNMKMPQIDTACACKGNQCNGQSGVINFAD